MKKDNIDIVSLVLSIITVVGGAILSTLGLYQKSRQMDKKVEKAVRKHFQEEEEKKEKGKEKEK